MVTIILKILNNSTKNDKMGCNISKSFSNDANDLPSKVIDILGINISAIEKPKACYGPNKDLIAAISNTNNIILRNTIDSKPNSAFNRVQPLITNNKY